MPRDGSPSNDYHLREVADGERRVVCEVGEGDDRDFEERREHRGVKTIEILETQLGSDLACFHGISSVRRMEASRPIAGWAPRSAHAGAPGCGSQS